MLMRLNSSKQAQPCEARPLKNLPMARKSAIATVEDDALLG